MSKLAHPFKGGRHRPENSDVTSYPAASHTRVSRNQCRTCGGPKSVHFDAPRGQFGFATK